METTTIRIPYYLIARKTLEELLDEGKTLKEINSYYRLYDDTKKKVMEEVMKEETYFFTDK